MTYADLVDCRWTVSVLPEVVELATVARLGTGTATIHLTHTKRVVDGGTLDRLLQAIRMRWVRRPNLFRSSSGVTVVDAALRACGVDIVTRKDGVVQVPAKARVRTLTVAAWIR